MIDAGRFHVYSAPSPNVPDVGPSRSPASPPNFIKPSAVELIARHPVGVDEDHLPLRRADADGVSIESFEG